MLALYLAVMVQLVATAMPSVSLCHGDGNVTNQTLCYRSEMFYDQKGNVYIFNGILNQENSVHATCLNDTTLSHDLKFETYSEDPTYPVLNISVSTTIQATHYTGYTSCDMESDLFYCQKIYLWNGRQGALADVALSMEWQCDLDGSWPCSANSDPAQHTALCHDDGSIDSQKVCYRSELFYDLGDADLRKVPFKKDFVYVVNGELSKKSSVHVTCLNDTTLSHDLKFETYIEDTKYPVFNITLSAIIRGTRYAGYTSCDMESDLFYCQEIFLWKHQQGAPSDVALHTRWSCDLDGEWLCETPSGLPLSRRDAHLRSGKANFVI